MSERSSKRQRELLSFVDSFIKGNGYGPSYREIMRALGYKSVSTVAVHIDNLIAKGYLIKKDHSARSLEVVTTEISANTSPASPHEAENRKWLEELIVKKIEAGEDPTSEDLAEYETLIKSLQILGFELEAKRAQSKLNEIV